MHAPHASLTCQLIALFATLFTRQEVVDSARLGGLQNDPNVPELVGGVLKEECDAAFLDSFSVFRDKKYLESMQAHGEHEYLKENGIISSKDEL
jgi:hypothetical protein